MPGPDGIKYMCHLEDFVGRVLTTAQFIIHAYFKYAVLFLAKSS